MDPRLYMLAGTFALLLIAVITAVISMVRAMRRRRREYSVPPVPVGGWSGTSPDQSREVDTSLEGLEVKVHAESPSAALLVPLRTGTWIPPESPAPVDKLPEAALETRIATYPVSHPGIETIPDVATEEPSASAPAAEALPVAEPPVESAAAEPLVEVAQQAVAPESRVEPPTESLPEHPAPAAVPEALLSVPEVLREEANAATAVPAPLAEENVDAEPVLAEPVAESLEAQQDLGPSAPLEQKPRNVWLPPQVSGVPTQIAPTPVGPPTPFEQLVPLPPHEIPLVFVPAIERPAAVVHQPPPEPEPGPEPPPVEFTPTPSPRPRAVVRTTGAERDANPVATRVSPLAVQLPIDEPGVRQETSDIVMAAPVEMWFGDHRVGVKEGSKTYDQFRRYADVLFDDLRVARKT